MTCDLGTHDIMVEDASPDTIWQLLTPAERNKFLKAVANPSSELAQQLLADEKLERDRQEPWWTAKPVSDDDSITLGKPGRKPTMMPIPAKTIQSQPNLSLMYNISAVL